MDHPLPATTAQWTARMMLARGVCAADLFEGTDLGPGWLEDAQASVLFRDYERLVINALDASQEPSLGLSLGAQQQLPELGVYGYAVMSSATIAGAAETAERFWDVSGSLMRLQPRAELEAMRWSFHPTFPMVEPRVYRFAVEETLAALATGSGLLLGRRMPFASAEVSYVRPSYGNLYRQVLGQEVTFGADETAVSIPQHYGSLRVRTHSAEMAEDSRRRCQAIAEGRARPGVLIQAIQDAIVQSAGQLSHLEEVASHIGVSPRTLQRRLRDAGTTFQAVRNDMRERLAKALLQDPSLRVEEVAQRLGFTAATNFRVAFKRWTGMTVQQFRRGAS